MPRSNLHLVVTLLEEKLEAVANGSASYDLEELVTQVPNVSVLGGDTRISVEVSVPAERASELKDKLRGLCSVSPSRMLSLQ